MKTLLVTGGAGFIGSNFIHYILTCDTYAVVNLDALTYAGSLENLRDVEIHPCYTFVKGNICDRTLLHALFAQYKFDAIINFAAESHVDRSIENPTIFLETNVMGTQALLDTARASWKVSECRYRDGVRFIQISTDEVYGALGATGRFTEETPLSPSSPYSASKAAADMLVTAYYKTYALPINITRCSNNYGPYQYPEKFIPLMISNCIQNKPLPVYGDGLQVRDWIYVEDHCRAVHAVLEHGKIGEVYNIGGDCERYNIDIVREILRLTGKPETLISYVKDRLGHDRRYAVDCSKLQRELGWETQHSFADGLRETVQWYREYAE